MNMKRSFSTSIAIDLTPILPGGENGGAKIFIIELIKHLSIQAPDIQFLLLTHERSHQELRILDNRNVKRMVVIEEQSPVLKLRLSTLTTLTQHYIRNMKKWWVGHQRTELNLMKLKNTQLLFCPFSAPTYHQDNIPTVCTIYDLQYQTYPDFFTQQEKQHRHQLFLDACSKSKKLITISDYTKKTVIQHGEVDPSRVQTVYMQMVQRTTNLAKKNHSLLKKLNLFSQRYLIYPANFWKHKNHQALFTAFAIAKEQQLDPTIKLVCTGTPNAHSQWLLDSIKAMKLDNNIVLTGYLSHTELASLLMQAKGMIFPSLYEGFGIPVIEAFAHQIPVACSNLSALPEAAQTAAIIFNPKNPADIAEAILQLARLSPDERLLSIESGKKRATDFSNPSKMANEYLTVFKELIHEN
ncbi:MAG: glycosyltransferase family 1 protein [Gammaproteobacteria bacterium]|nr:glycosyltransferase family 1 protein [Gammaproteobacteria bacterium]